MLDEEFIQFGPLFIAGESRNGTFRRLPILRFLYYGLNKPLFIPIISSQCYTAIAMAIRYFGKAYAVGGKFVVANNFAPKFGNAGAAAALSPNVFILVSMLSTAYMAHFNAPKFYKELKNNTVGRFNTVVFSSFGISILLFSAIASLGFLTFGSASNGLILNNYANADGLMSLSRIAVFVSLVFS